LIVYLIKSLRRLLEATIQHYAIIWSIYVSQGSAST